MRFHGLQIHLIINLSLILVIVTSSLPVPPPNCTNLCGNVSIPYPFGTTEECSLNHEFLLTCNQTFDPPRPLFIGTNIEITDISLDGQVTVSQYISYDCYDQINSRISNAGASITLFPWTVSTANKLTVVGCDSYGNVYGNRLNGRDYWTGCTVTCDAIEDVEAGSCTGLGCCQTSIPKQVWEVQISLGSYSNYSNVSGSYNNRCTYAFLAKDGAFTFSAESYASLYNTVYLPMVVDWTTGNETCEEPMVNSSAYACKSANSSCYKPDNVFGYRCSCVEGYQGNPYLVDGCQDIDECQDPENICEKDRCVNTPGNYTCVCPKGYHGDGRKDGKGCSRGESFVFKIVAGVASGVIVLLLSACWLHLEFNRRKNIKMKQQFFLQNGGQLLQEKLIGRQSTSNAARIFSASELQKATNNFHDSMIIGQGGHGTVYKGVLQNDHKVIAIKKSKKVDSSEVDQFINEVVVLSQINHRNVVKLLGCCLETEAPLLVYEFISNGTLYQHIHNKAITRALSWDMRLRIATETAGVLSYLHSAASTPIIHRDVKTANILLDHTYTAKVADFGASRLVPLDDSQLSTFVQGTFGYLDPEYLQSRQLNEKSDVYSFGVVLMELLTGRKALIKDGPEEEQCLANFFLKVMKEEKLFQVVENNLMREGDREVVIKFAVLAKRCVNVRGEKRPSMKEVAMELEGLQVGTGKRPWINTEGVVEDEESLLSRGFSDSFIDGEGNSTNTGVFSNGGNNTSGVGFDSLKDYMILHGGR